jgi:hypothetical protein
VFLNAPISSPPPNPSPTSFSLPFIFFYFPFKNISGDIQELNCSCCNLAKQVEARGSTLRASTNQKSKEKSATEGSLFQRCFTNYEKRLEVAGGNTPATFQSLRRNPLTKSSLHRATSKCFVGSQQELPKASVAETRLCVLIFVLVQQCLDLLYLWDVSDGDSVTVKMPNHLKQDVSGSGGLKSGSSAHENLLDSKTDLVDETLH